MVPGRRPKGRTRYRRYWDIVYLEVVWRRVGMSKTFSQERADLELGDAHNTVALL